MPSTYTNNNGFTLQANGENNLTWGTLANNGVIQLIDTALDGSVTLTLSGTTSTLAITDGAASDGRNRIIICAGTLTANHTITVTPNDAEKWYWIHNNTTGGFNVIIAQGGGSGTTVTIMNQYWACVMLDGTGTNANVARVANNFEIGGTLKAATFTGTTVSASASVLSPSYTGVGAIAIKPGGDSTTAIQIQNFGGTSIINVDTTNSRVGIGTTAPIYQSVVLGAGQATAALTDAGAKGGTIQINDSGSSAGNGGALVLGASVAGGNLPQVAAKAILKNGASNGVSDLVFSVRVLPGDTALTEAARITSDKRLGIGVTPLVPLHALGHASNEIARLQARTDSSNARSFFSLYTTNPNYWWNFSTQDSVGGGTLNNLTLLSRQGDTGLEVARVTVVGATGNVGIGTVSPAQPLEMASGAHVTTGGTWTNASDAALKSQFESIDRQDILRRLCDLPVTTWQYKTEKGVVHIGPTSQDFRAAFGVGGSDKGISTVDGIGVALAAIQALHLRMENTWSRRLARYVKGLFSR